MAWPDDEHEPVVIHGDDGGVVAVAHVGPGFDEEAAGHLRDVVDAVRRRMEAEDTPEQQARAEAAQARNRERLERIRGGG